MSGLLRTATVPPAVRVLEPFVAAGLFGPSEVHLAATVARLCPGVAPEVLLGLAVAAGASTGACVHRSPGRASPHRRRRRPGRRGRPAVARPWHVGRCAGRQFGRGRSGERRDRALVPAGVGRPKALPAAILPIRGVRSPGPGRAGGGHVGTADRLRHRPRRTVRSRHRRRAGPAAPGRRGGPDPRAVGDRRRPGNRQDPHHRPPARRCAAARRRGGPSTRCRPRRADRQGGSSDDRGGPLGGRSGRSGRLSEHRCGRTDPPDRGHHDPLPARMGARNSFPSRPSRPAAP